MKTIDVYRVENADGEGMYTAKEACLAHGSFPVFGSKVHPTYQGRKVPESYRFGFPSIALAARWLLSMYHSAGTPVTDAGRRFIHNAPGYLSEHGFRLNQYRVWKQNYALCDTLTQCQFKYDGKTTTLVKSHPLMQLWEYPEERISQNEIENVRGDISPWLPSRLKKIEKKLDCP